jgi:nucleoside-diphosphate-sugar epimerase
MTTHVVLGGGGVVGRETVTALLSAGRSVRSVTRTAPAGARLDDPHPGLEHAAADLLDAASTARALQGAEVAYLTVGLPYTTRTWRRDWPVVVRNTIEACLAGGTHLVHLDNVYAYGRTDQPMTESTPIRPTSRKGAVRAELLAMLGTARDERGLAVTIARSADFYGPGAATSAFNTFAIDAVAAGRAPTWLFDATQPHAMTYTPDLGAALAVLGTDDRARGRTWHAPTAPALTGEQYLALVAGDSGLPHRTMSSTTMRVGALFSSAARETLEMAYQYTAPYRFDSSAFEQTFGVRPTPYAEGIATALEHARSMQRTPALR